MHTHTCTSACAYTHVRARVHTHTHTSSIAADPTGKGRPKLGARSSSVALLNNPPVQATGHTMWEPPHQSLLFRLWRASVSPSSGFEKGLNSLKARRSTSSSSSSHSGEPRVSTAGSELAALEEERQQASPGRMEKMEERERLLILRH